MQILLLIGWFQKNVKIMSQKGLSVHGLSILTVISCEFHAKLELMFNNYVFSYKRLFWDFIWILERLFAFWIILIVIFYYFRWRGQWWNSRLVITIPTLLIANYIDISIFWYFQKNSIHRTQSFVQMLMQMLQKKIWKVFLAQ